MINPLTIVLAFLVLIAVYSISLYNWFQTSLTRITASIQEIGNQLKRQASLIPNLQESVKGYLKHEKEIYQALTNARKMVESASTSRDIGKMDKAAEQISSLIPKLQVLVESNPELKAQAVVSRLMDELRDTADKLTYSRRVVIDLSADFNQRLVTLPSSIIAKAMGFQPQKGLSTPTVGSHLELSESETQDPKISL